MQRESRECVSGRRTFNGDSNASPSSPFRNPKSAVRNESGFTLIELTVVVLLIGLIVAVAATRLDSMVPKYRLRGAARDVGSILRQGKSRAAAQGKDLYFEMDLSRGQYWLLAPFPKEDAGQDPKAVDGRAVEYQPVFVHHLPDGVQFTDVILGDKDKVTTGHARLRLTPYGTSSHTIVNFRNSENREIALKMNGYTGMISFHDQHLEADELLEDKAP